MGNTIIKSVKGSVLSIEKKSNFGFNFGRDIPVYMLLLPALVMIIIFNYLPIYGIIIAFQDFNPFKGVLKSNWVGLANFVTFFTDDRFWIVLKNTVLINLYTIIFGFPAPIIFALLLNEVTRSVFKRFIQTISYLPFFISWVVVAGLVISVVSPSTGIFTIFLNKVFGVEPSFLLGKPELFRGIVVTTSIWKETGMMSIYYLASLATIDPQLYEAARIDGANRWKQTIHITLPGLRSIITILLLISIGNLVTIGFEQIFLLYNPLVYDVGDVLSTYTYRMGIEQTRFSMTTAIGVTQSVVSFIMVVSANKIAKKLAGWSLW